jgi:hypothetical protein
LDADCGRALLLISPPRRSAARARLDALRVGGMTAHANHRAVVPKNAKAHRDEAK